jgi:hypothetical protein
MFAVPFDEIAHIVGRSPTAARQLASRARRRVQGAGAPVADPATLWEVQVQFDPDELPDLAATFLRGLPVDEYPYLVEHVHQHLKEGSPEDEGEFAFGLDLILDGLERLRR